MYIEGLVRKLLLRFMKSDYVCKLSTIDEVCLDDEAQYLMRFMLAIILLSILKLWKTLYHCT